MEEITIIKDNKSNKITVEFYSEEARKYFLAFVRLYNKDYKGLIRILEKN